VPSRQSVDERPEPDALHYAPDGDLPAFAGRSPHSAAEPFTGGLFSLCRPKKNLATSLRTDLLKRIHGTCSFAGAHADTSTHGFGFYIALIFMYLWMSGHCPATMYPTPTTKPNNSSLFMPISPPLRLKPQRPGLTLLPSSLISSTSDSTSFTASSTATRTGSLNSISISS